MFQEAKVGGQLVMAIAQHLSKEKMKGRDRAGREDLSVEAGFEHICQWGKAADEIETAPPDRPDPSNSPLGTKLPPLSISHQQW